jgi:hypothetical protein
MEDTMKSFNNKVAKRRRRVNTLARLEQDLVSRKNYLKEALTLGSDGLYQQTKGNIARIEKEISTLKGRV